MPYLNKSFMKMCLGFGFLIVIGSILFVLMARSEGDDTGLEAVVQSTADLTGE